MMAAEGVVEFAHADDLPALVSLLSALFTQESDFAPDPAKQLDALRLILDDPAIGQLFVLRVDGRVAGMANALITVSTAEGGPVVLLEDVIVDRELRGQGYGRMLVEQVCTWAAAEGMTRVTLLTDADNHAAHGFYAHLGFMPSDMRVLRRGLG